MEEETRTDQILRSLPPRCAVDLIELIHRTPPESHRKENRPSSRSSSVRAPSSWGEGSTLSPTEQAFIADLPRRRKQGLPLSREEAEFVLRYATFRHERRVGIAAYAGFNHAPSTAAEAVEKVKLAFKKVTHREPNERELKSFMGKTNLSSVH